MVGNLASFNGAGRHCPGYAEMGVAAMVDDYHMQLTMRSRARTEVQGF
jgi:hypothetical protein